MFPTMTYVAVGLASSSIDILTPGLETERRAHKSRCNTPCLNEIKRSHLSS